MDISTTTSPVNSNAEASSTKQSVKTHHTSENSFKDEISKVSNNVDIEGNDVESQGPSSADKKDLVEKVVKESKNQQSGDFKNNLKFVVVSENDVKIQTPQNKVQKENKSAEIVKLQGHVTTEVVKTNEVSKTEIKQNKDVMKPVKPNEVSKTEIKQNKDVMKPVKPQVTLKPEVKETKANETVTYQQNQAVESKNNVVSKTQVSKKTVAHSSKNKISKTTAHDFVQKSDVAAKSRAVNNETKNVISKKQSLELMADIDSEKKDIISDDIEKIGNLSKNISSVRSEVTINSDDYVSDNISDGIDFTAEDISIVNQQAQVLIDANILLAKAVHDAKIPVKVDYNTVQMDMDDAQFFNDLVQDTDTVIQNVVQELSQKSDHETHEVQKHIRVSSTLMQALSDAVKNNQSFRIDFDKDISVIIKVDRDGSLSAKFIPGDSAVEQYLKQNISSLRQRFDEQDLPYNELSYTGQQKRERRNNNKENGHE